MPSPHRGEGGPKGRMRGRRLGASPPWVPSSVSLRSTASPLKGEAFFVWGAASRTRPNPVPAESSGTAKEHEPVGRGTTPPMRGRWPKARGGRGLPPPRADEDIGPYEDGRTICVGHEKVNWPEGPREAGLGRDPGAPEPGACRVVRRHEKSPPALLRRPGQGGRFAVPTNFLSARSPLCLYQRARLCYTDYVWAPRGPKRRRRHGSVRANGEQPDHF